jgi:cell division protein FtsB
MGALPKPVFLYCAAGALISGFALYLWLSPNGLAGMKRQQDTIDQVTNGNRAIEKQLDEINSENEALEKSEHEKDRVIREELLYQKRGETTIITSPGKGQPARPTPTPSVPTPRP